MNIAKHNQVFLNALMIFGKKAQAVKFVEESSELNKILCKYANDLDYSDDELIDELADVHIMLEQMMINFSSEKQQFRERVESRIDSKVFKLNQALTNHGKTS